MFRSILVPLDGSPLAEHALCYALSIARRSSAEVHVALVHLPVAYRDESVGHSDEFDWEAKIREQAYLDALGVRLSNHFDGPIKRHHPEGLVEETLASLVEQHGIELIVMNAHGWGYISRALVGSVSDYLIRHVNAPVLMMHTEGESAPLERDVSIRRILLPLDGSELATSVLEPALAVGQLWQAEYNLLRVVTWSLPLSAAAREHPYPIPRSAKDRNITAAEDYLGLVARRIRDGHGTARTEVRENRNVAATILQAAAAGDCDLIAMSTHGRSGVSRLLLGGVTDKVVRQAHTPVLVYRGRKVQG